MSKKRKLQRFEECRTFPNMFHVPWEKMKEPFPWRGRWKEFFGHDGPVVLEVGCGKGEYTLWQAERHPENNYVGVDVKGARMWRGCKTSQEKGLKNVAFIRTHVQLLGYFFAAGEIRDVWVTFPDPQPRQSRARRRLTAPRFLDLYDSLLSPGGVIRLKTDNRALYEYTLGVIRETGRELLYHTADLYGDPAAPGIATTVQTFYEKMFLAEGKPICYLEMMPPPAGGKSRGSDFFDRVYAVARRIPYGRVTSYGAIARFLGTGMSARTVGWAMNNAHSDTLGVPAHRVVNRNGMLTGKHHFGGPGVMEQLLENEGVMVEDDRVVAFEALFWDPAEAGLELT